MRRKPVKLTALALALALSLGTASAALGAQKRESPDLAAASSQHMKITAPKNNSVFYKGETISLTLTVKRLDSSYLVRGAASLDNYSWFETFKRTGFTLKRKFSTKKLTAARHSFSAVMNVVYMGNDPGKSGSYTERVTSAVSLRVLKAPGGMKAPAAKGIVTVTWKKAAGATKYEVFRATKKNGVYKRIATVKGTRYVNKKLKKGASYYYKTRTIRDAGRGTVRSGFSTAVFSGKVK